MAVSLTPRTGLGQHPQFRGAGTGMNEQQQFLMTETLPVPSPVPKAEAR